MRDGRYFGAIHFQLVEAHHLPVAIGIGATLGLLEGRNQKHVGAVLVGPHVEIFVNFLTQYARRKGPE